MDKFFKIIISFVLGAIIFATGFWSHNSSTVNVVSETSGDYPFINRAVTSDIGKHFIINFKPLKNQLEAIQKKHNQNTYIYFSYLNNGSWVGLQEREEFTAASTLKVPLAMALMKAVENGKVKLEDSYDLEELDLNGDFGDLYKQGENQHFTVGELLKIMLEKSDNTAFNALYHVFQRLGVEDPLGDVYSVLGWEFLPSIPEIGSTPDYSKINLKTLSNMFIALYDAKYVGVESSNLILKYLANTPFDSQIRAGVPEGVMVSHKIGVAASEGTFSDCGIVYAPNRNYILCVGSSAAPEKEAAKFMAETSKAAYDYVINN